MDEFKIKLSRVRNAVQEQNNIAKQMRRLEDEVRKAYNRLDFEVAQKREVKKGYRRQGTTFLPNITACIKRPGLWATLPMPTNVRT